MKNQNSTLDRELTIYLNHRIDAELNKSESEVDSQMIDKYTVIIDHIEDHRYEPDPAIKQRQISELMSHYRQNKIAGTKRTLGRIAAVVLVFCGVAVGSLLTASAAMGMTPAELFDKLGVELFIHERNESIKNGDLTFIKAGKVKKYETIGKLIETEHLNILYPTWLPNGVVINKVMVSERDKGDEITFVFNDDTIVYIIKLYEYYNIDSLDKVNYKIITVNGNKVAYSVYNNQYTAFFELNGFSYNIITDTYEELYNILLGLR